MKKTISLAALLCFAIALFAQNNMRVKKFNTSSFNKDMEVSSPLLLKNSTAEAQKHPEFGVLPYNSQCANCVELINKRTIDSRFFIDPQNEHHTYSQQSYFPLHYKNSAGDVWHTIDPRLRPTAPGVYEATNQPVPSKCDLNKKSTSLTEHGFEFEFNKNLTMYFYDDNTLYTQKESGNYAEHSIGQEGLYVKNIWAGVDMEQLFTTGQVETNYIIAAPLQIPISHGWMVIEDHFTLPEGFSIVETGTDHLPGGLYRGSYEIKNNKNETIIIYDKPVYIDAKVLGMHGVYKLIKNDNDYTLQTLVPVEWLNSADNTYPLTIDPNVYGNTKLGDFSQTGRPSANLAFTSMSLGSCPYHMHVTVPGHSVITNTYVDVEYSLTYDNTCGTPALPPPFCTFSMVDMEVRSDSCGTSTGLMGCPNTGGPQTGTCTTDSNLTPGASAHQFSGLLPTSCYTSKCTDYTIPFTLLNRDSICGDVCGYLCARGNMWRMTVEAQDSGIYAYSHNDTLFSTSPVDNQWYFNNSPIIGATDPILIVNQLGSYYTEVNSNPYCNTSNVVDFACAAQFTMFNLDSIPNYPGIDSGYYYGVNYSSGAAISYLWDFGDGDTSSAQYPTHVYAQPGQYNVCLTVNSFLCTDTHCDSSFYVFKTEGGLMTRLIIQSPNTTGISETENEPAIKLYPNPATNELNIYSNGLPVEQIRLFSMDGRLIVQAKKGANKIDISNLAKGNYIAEIKVHNGVKRIHWTKL